MRCKKNFIKMRNSEFNMKNISFINFILARFVYRNKTMKLRNKTMKLRNYKKAGSSPKPLPNKAKN
jgi:hypothetical protein